MVELAIVLPLLLMLLFGITELGRALFQENSLYKAVSTGARYLARSNEALAYDDEGNCTEDGDWPDVPSLTVAENLIVFGNTTGTGPPLLPNLSRDTIEITVVPQTLTTSDGAVGICKIRVRAWATFAGLFGDIVIPFTSIESFDIRAETEERYIGY